jgi:riboflavin synthase
MFTGIIESTGRIERTESHGANKTFWIASPLSPELKVDQSLAHDGVCLTVEEIKEGMHRVTAIGETLRKSTLGKWKKGHIINLERSLKLNDRLDGHLVQGHVDCIANCLKIEEAKGSWEFQFEFPRQFAPLVIEKGSICLNGVSLTVFDVKKKRFRVAIIPYTFEHTNLNALRPGQTVNLEFDLVGKYITRSRQV